MFGKTLIIASLCLVMPGIAPVCHGGVSGGPILLADDSKKPHVVVRWMRADGSETVLEADVPYGSPEDRVVLGENIEVFAGLGGARLERDMGHPGGALVRVGIFKSDRDLLMFDDIVNGGEVVIELTNIFFNQPVVPNRQTIVQKLEYKAEDIIACGLAIDQTEMFNVRSEDDNMGGTILPQQVRYSYLGGGEAGSGEVVVTIEDDGGLSLRATVPYRLLRHKGDPWALEVPGTFFEPFHFDLEVEVLPWDIAAAEGIEG